MGLADWNKPVTKVSDSLGSRSNKPYFVSHLSKAATQRADMVNHTTRVSEIIR